MLLNGYFIVDVFLYYPNILYELILNEGLNYILIYFRKMFTLFIFLYIDSLKKSTSL